MKNALRTLLCLAAVAVSSSCVAQQRYTDMANDYESLQRQYLDLSSFQAQLEAENARLRGELALREGTPIDSSATRDIDERIERLKRLTEQIGTSSGAAPGDVTFFQVEGGYGVRVTDAVLFDSGSDQIKPEGRSILEEVAKQITSQPYQRIWVRGHTDSDPVAKPETRQRFPHGNLQLSAARAIEVAALLQSLGVRSDKVVVAGFGPAESVAPNDSAENKRRNRRVEIFVLEDEALAGGR